MTDDATIEQASEAPVEAPSEAPVDNRLTFTQMNTVKRCSRKYCLRYVLGIVPRKQSAPLHIGSAVHLGLDLHAQGMSQDDAISAVYERMFPPQDTPTSEEAASVWEYRRETVGRMLSAYWWRWRLSDEQCEVVATEQEFRIPLRNPATGASSRTWELAGKVDKIIRRPDGSLWLREHKTCGEDIDDPSAPYWRRLTIDSQVSIYMRAARELGYDVQGVEYDVLRKPTIRPSSVPILDADGLKVVVDDTTGERARNKNGSWRQSGGQGFTTHQRRETPREFGERFTETITEAPARFFARRDIPRTNRDLEEADYDAWTTGRIISDCQRLNRWPRNTGACVVFGQCEYFDLCTIGFDPSTYDGFLVGDYMVTDNKHPELSEIDTEEDA